MKRLCILLLAAAPIMAMAMTYYLESEWTDKTGARMCKYSNGTTLNVGYKTCPRSIQG